MVIELVDRHIKQERHLQIFMTPVDSSNNVDNKLFRSSTFINKFSYKVAKS